MRAAVNHRATAGRDHAVVVLGLLALVMDVVVVLATLGQTRSFLAAPKNDVRAAGDDPTYLLTSLAYAGASAIRYLVLIGFIVVVLCAVASLRLTVGRRVAAAVLLVGAELVYVATTWRTADPTGDWCRARVGSVLASALITVVVIVVVRRRRAGRGPDPDRAS